MDTESEIRRFNGDDQQLIDLEGAWKTGKWPFPIAIPCRICQKPSRIFRHVGFCRQHHRERETRQRNGVPRDQLSALWQDTLATWKGRPGELRKEPEPESLQLSGLGGENETQEWLMFEKGYPNRLPDWLLFNTRTGEIRRFVKVSYEDIAEDLLGGNPAPDQERLPDLWGKPADDMVFGAISDMIESARLIAESAHPAEMAVPGPDEVVLKMNFPVFGLVDDVMELRFHSFTYGGGPHGYDSVSLCFVEPPAAREEGSKAVWIESHLRRYRMIHQEPGLKRWRIRRTASELWEAFAPSSMVEESLGKGRSRLEGIDALGESAVEDIAVHMPMFPARTEALIWEEKKSLTGVLLENDRSQLVIASLGLTNSEITALTRVLLPINDRPEVLAAYRAEFDARLEQIVRAYGQQGP